MSFEKLSEAIKKRYPSQPLQASQIVAVAQKVLGDKAQAISYSEGSLRVAVPNPYVASEMRANSQDVIQAINQKLGRETIERLVFRLG